MAETDLKTFNYEAFAKELAGQAKSLLPPEIPKEDGDLIVQTIEKLCFMAGDALAKEENSTVDAQQANLIIQFIGEWTFHKSIDLIKAGVEMEFRESVLTTVSIAIFRFVKDMFKKNLPVDDRFIALVENQVAKTFAKAIAELMQRNKISKETAENALTQSNLDNMAQEQVQDEIAIENACSNISDAKVLKLASLAILIKNFPMEKVKSILMKFNKPERDVLIKYLKEPNLEEKFDMNTASKYFKEIKNTLPEAVVVSYERAYKKMYKIVKNSSKNEILSIIEHERPAVQEYILSCFTKKKKKIPAYVAEAISKYLEENVS